MKSWRWETYSDGKGNNYQAISITWQDVKEILGHEHRGIAEDDQRLIHYLKQQDAPTWIEYCEGWTDEEVWGIYDPTKKSKSPLDKVQ